MIFYLGYIFVRINIDEQKRLVSYTQGVSHIVLFNDKYVIVSEKIINLVKNSANENMNKNPISSLKIGDNIIISNGVMSGHTAKGKFNFAEIRKNKSTF